MIEQLLLCALKRYGNLAAAADLVEVANKLVLDEGLPRAWMITSIPKAAGVLKSMCNRHMVARIGSRQENGRQLPLYAPGDRLFNALEPVPQPTVEEQHAADRAQLESLTSDQQLALFDLLRARINSTERWMAAIVAAIREASDVLDRDYERIRSRMVSSGLAEKTGIR